MGDGADSADGVETRHIPERLVHALDRLPQAYVASISGPAGFGKHELVHAWLARHPEVDSAWIHEPDDLPAALAVAARQGDERLRVLVATGPAAAADPRLLPELMELVERDNRVRLVLVGRMRPEVPLGSLATRGLLVDIDGDQLAWTREEVRECLLTNNPELPEVAIDTIMSGSRGWPAIVWMLADEPLGWSHTARITRLADSYIADEVLAGLDQDDLDLLHRLAPLASLTPTSAGWLAERSDAAAQLLRLQAHGVPITWDDDNTIRLNPVLRGHLTRRLWLEDPERAAGHTEHAVLWLRSRGHVTEAIALAMQASQTELAWQLAGEFIATTLYRPEMAQQLPTLVELLPPGWELDTVRSVERGLATPETMIAQVHAINPAQMVARGTTSRLGYACFVLGMVRRLGYRHELDVSDAVEIAGSTTAAGVHELDLGMLSTAQAERGCWLLHQGRLDEARESLLAALGTARVVDSPWLVAMTLGALALVHAEWGEVQVSRRLADEAVLTCAETPFTTDALDEKALLALAVTALDSGELPAARRWLEQLSRHREDSTENDALRTWVAADLATAEGDPGSALRLVRAYRDQSRNLEPPGDGRRLARAAFDAAIAVGDLQTARAELARLESLGEDDDTTLVLVRARMALAEQSPERAHELLAPLVDPESSRTLHPRATLHALMVHGIAADQLHLPSESLQDFQRAGVLAGRMGLDTSAARHTWVAVASRHEEPLTEAERNVLLQLDTTRTLAETAEALFISLNTLKTHLRRIYRKLGVANREQAIERARVMGLHQGH